MDMNEFNVDRVHGYLLRCGWQDWLEQVADQPGFPLDPKTLRSLARDAVRAFDQPVDDARRKSGPWRR